jgi:hypothetical protein
MATILRLTLENKATARSIPRFHAGDGHDAVVAYLSRDRVHLLCRRHTPEAPISDDHQYRAVTAEELQALGIGFRPGGGGHRCSVCNLDVLTV